MLNKLNQILSGWSNYVFESAEIKSMAMARAAECGKCDHAVDGFVAELIGDEIKDIEGLKCNLCDCPLSGLLRSKKSKCKINKWQAKIK